MKNFLCMAFILATMSLSGAANATNTGISPMSLRVSAAVMDSDKETYDKLSNMEESTAFKNFLEYSRNIVISRDFNTKYENLEAKITEQIKQRGVDKDPAFYKLAKEKGLVSDEGLLSHAMEYQELLSEQFFSMRYKKESSPLIEDLYGNTFEQVCQSGCATFDVADKVSELNEFKKGTASDLIGKITIIPVYQSKPLILNIMEPSSPLVVSSRQTNVMLYKAESQKGTVYSLITTSLPIEVESTLGKGFILEVGSAGINVKMPEGMESVYSVNQVSNLVSYVYMQSFGMLKDYADNTANKDVWESRKIK